MAEPVAAIDIPMDADAPSDEAEVAPLLSVPRLTELILTPNCPSAVLIQYLVCVPNSCDAVIIIEELCMRDLAVVFSYLLSLHATHWHRDPIKEHLGARMLDMSTSAIMTLRQYIPKLSALQFDDTTNTWQAFIGPLSSMETSRWDTHDWFYQLLHAKQMKGQLLFITIALSLFPRTTLRFL